MTFLTTFFRTPPKKNLDYSLWFLRVRTNPHFYSKGLHTMQHVLSHTLSPVSVVPEAEELQDLSVVVQELAQSIQLLIGSQWLHGRRQLYTLWGRDNGKQTLNSVTAFIPGDDHLYTSSSPKQLTHQDSRMLLDTKRMSLWCHTRQRKLAMPQTRSPT